MTKHAGGPWGRGAAPISGVSGASGVSLHPPSCAYGPRRRRLLQEQALAPVRSRKPGEGWGEEVAGWRPAPRAATGGGPRAARRLARAGP